MPTVTQEHLPTTYLSGTEEPPEKLKKIKKSIQSLEYLHCISLPDLKKSVPTWKIFVCTLSSHLLNVVGCEKQTSKKLRSFYFKCTN